MYIILLKKIYISYLCCFVLKLTFYRIIIAQIFKNSKYSRHLIHQVGQILDHLINLLRLISKTQL